MAERSKDFMLNTLKGKVWLAVITLAIINCVVGTIAFIGISDNLSEKAMNEIRALPQIVEALEFTL